MLYYIHVVHLQTIYGQLTHFAQTTPYHAICQIKQQTLAKNCETPKYLCSRPFSVVIPHLIPQVQNIPR